MTVYNDINNLTNGIVSELGEEQHPQNLSMCLITKTL